MVNEYLTRDSRILSGEMTISLINVAGKIGYSCKKMKIDPYLIPLPQINMKWIKDLNVRSESMRLLEGNVGKKLLNMGLGHGFFVNHT